MKTHATGKRLLSLLLLLTMFIPSMLLVSCGKEEHTHTYSSLWSSDATNHWHAANCGHDEKADVAPHAFNAANVCSVCGYDANTSHSSSATVTISADKTEIKKGETLTLRVTVTGVTDTSVTWTSSDPDLLTVANGVVTWVDGSKVDRYVTITAASVADPNAKATKTLLYKAEKVEGQVGELTSALLAEIGNPSITVKGTVQDVYENLESPSKSKTQSYDMTVEMAEGKWNGSWNAAGSKNVITDRYRKGAQIGTDEGSHYMDRIFINKDNEVATKSEKDNNSVYVSWENNHLWNCLGDLPIDGFEWNVDLGGYVHSLDVNSEDDLYLMTYLSFALTPMLSDTLNVVVLYVEGGHITRMKAETEKLAYGNEDNTEDDPTAYSWTSFDVTFSGVGTTVPSDPTPFVGDSFTDILQAALDSMGDARDYTFHAAEHTTYAPSGNEGDYYMDAVGAGSAPLAASSTTTSSTGTVGTVGYVTEGAVILSKTGKYEYAMDDNLFFTTVTGYKQITADYYNTFESVVDSTDPNGGYYYGTHKVMGSIFDVMPKFEFKAEIFTLSSMIINADTGLKEYTFSLRVSEVTRDVAMQVAMKDLAKNACADSAGSLTITCDENGKLLSVSFPWDSYGVYAGNYVISFVDIGATQAKVAESKMAVLLDNANFRERQIMSQWNQYEIDDFWYLHTTNHTKAYDCYYEDVDGKPHWKCNEGLPCGHVVSGQYAVEYVFGDAASDVVTPGLFIDVFGDFLYGPWYEDKSNGTDGTGATKYVDYLSFTASSQNVDENGKIDDYDELMAALDEAMAEAGYAKQESNCGLSAGGGYRYRTYVKGDVQIVVENNFTAYFWIYLYNTNAEKYNYAWSKN